LITDRTGKRVIKGDKNPQGSNQADMYAYADNITD
jgi:hypothetical protein